MHALIVFAHPEPQSFNGALKDVASRTLQDLGWEVTVSDLYAMDFQAAAGPTDFDPPARSRPFSLLGSQRRVGQELRPSQVIRLEQDKLRQADLLVLQFPLWWYGVPAILKGWFDRALSHGVAYDDTHLFDTGLLGGRHALLSLTTGATQAELEADAPRTGTLQELLRPIEGGVLGFVGFKVQQAFTSHAPASMTPAQRTAELSRWREHLRAVVSPLSSAR